MIPSNLPKIGLLGLGIIGSRVAENLRKAGYEVAVWSRSSHPVPNFKGSPREVAQASSVIQIFVRNDEALLEALREMQPVLTPNHVVMNHATVSKAATMAAADICAQAGAAA